MVTGIEKKIGFLKLEEYCIVSTLKMNLEVEKYLETNHITSHFDVALQLNAQWQKLFFKVALEPVVVGHSRKELLSEEIRNLHISWCSAIVTTL